jgi:hypothetical protein
LELKHYQEALIAEKAYLPYAVIALDVGVTTYQLPLVQQDCKQEE